MKGKGITVFDQKDEVLLTQEALAEELGVLYATICRREKDNRGPQIVSQGKHR